MTDTTTLPQDTGADLPPTSTRTGLEREPVITRQLALAIVGVIVSILAVWGLSIPPAYTEIVVIGIMACSGLVAAALSRLKAWAPDSVERALVGAYRAGVAGSARPTITGVPQAVRDPIANPLDRAA